MTADPVAEVHAHRFLLDQLLDKWSVAVLELLCERPSRFNELRRGIPGVTQKSLVATLRRLERNGVVSRRVLDARPVAVEYAITPLGKTLREPVDALLGWIRAHVDDVRAAQESFDPELHGVENRRGDPDPGDAQPSVR